MTVERITFSIFCCGPGFPIKEGEGGGGGKLVLAEIG